MNYLTPPEANRKGFFLKSISTVPLQFFYISRFFPAANAERCKQKVAFYRNVPCPKTAAVLVANFVNVVEIKIHAVLHNT